MIIDDIRLLPLRGATPDGGWDEKLLRGETNLHTLVEVVTDEGVTGLGSVFTSETLIRGAIDVIRPFLIGRVSVRSDGHHRTSSSTIVLAGTRRGNHACDLGSRHRVVGHSGQGHGPTDQPLVGRSVS